MNKKITLLAILLLTTVSSLFSATQINQNKISIVDYKNKNIGEQIPQWVKEVAMGNYSPNIFRNIPNIKKNANNKFFVISRRDRDFETAVSKSEMDMKKEYSSIFQRLVGKAMMKSGTITSTSTNNSSPITIDSPSNYFSINSSKITEDTSHFLQNLNYCDKEFSFNYTIGNLPSYVNKLCDFWIFFEERNSNNEIVNSYYDYYLVYTADKVSYDSELEKAISYNNKVITTNNFSIKAKTPTNIVLFNKYNTVMDIELDINGNLTHSYINSDSNKTEKETSLADVIPLFSHTRSPSIEQCRKQSLENDILKRFNLVLPKEKITPLLKNKNEIIIDVYNNNEYICTDYFCIYEVNKNDITKAMKSYY